MAEPYLSQKILEQRHAYTPSTIPDDTASNATSMGSTRSHRTPRYPVTVNVAIRSCEFRTLYEATPKQYTLHVSQEKEALLRLPLREGKMPFSGDGTEVSLRLVWSEANTFSRPVVANTRCRLRPAVCLEFELLEFDVMQQSYRTMARNTVVIEDFHPQKRKGKVTLGPHTTCMIEVMYTNVPIPLASAGPGMRTTTPVLNSVSSSCRTGPSERAPSELSCEMEPYATSSRSAARRRTYPSNPTEDHRPSPSRKARGHVPHAADPDGTTKIARVERLEAQLSMQEAHIRSLEVENQRVQQKLREKADETQSLKRHLYHQRSHYRARNEKHDDVMYETSQTQRGTGATCECTIL